MYATEFQAKTKPKRFWYDLICIVNNELNKRRMLNFKTWKWRQEIFLVFFFELMKLLIVWLKWIISNRISKLLHIKQSICWSARKYGKHPIVVYISIFSILQHNDMFLYVNFVHKKCEWIDILQNNYSISQYN